MSFVEKKVLLRFLATKDAGKEFISFMRLYVNAVDSIDLQNFLVIKHSRKEGELKIWGRWFGQTTFSNRLRMQQVEKNTRSFLSIYNSNQSMTLSALDYDKKLDTFGQLGRQKNPATKTIFLKLDISGWNSAFREETCSLTATFLDNVFGDTYYRDFMKIFQMTSFYAPAGTGTRSWEGQLGGVEGLHQYTWVVVYEVALRLKSQIIYL